MVKKAGKSHKMPTTSKNQTFWYNRHNRLGLLIVVVIFVIAGYFLLFSNAATPSAPNVYLSPSSQTYAANATFTVQVRENSGGTSVNAVQANFSYPTSLVSFVSISTTNSAFTNVAQSSGSGGQVSIGAGVSTSSGSAAPVTGDQLVATVTFKTLSSGGAATMAFTSGTALVNSTTNQDILGSLSNTTGGTYNVDTSAPATSVTSPANGATVGGSTVTISATASDTQSAITSVDFYVDGTKVGSDASSPYTYSWNTSSAALGSHTIQVKATDAVGNVGSSSVNTVTLADQTAPGAPGSLRVSSTTTSSITLTWTASTDNVGVTGYKVSRNGSLISTLSGTTLTYTDSGLSAATTYNYSVTAQDAAGNNSTAATVSGATSSNVPGDANGDGHVNITDLSIFLSNYGTASASCDFNHDGSVNILDFSILLNHYGS